MKTNTENSEFPARIRGFLALSTLACVWLAITAPAGFPRPPGDFAVCVARWHEGPHFYLPYTIPFRKARRFKSIHVADARRAGLTAAPGSDFRVAGPALWEFTLFVLTQRGIWHTGNWAANWKSCLAFGSLGDFPWSWWASPDWGIGGNSARRIKTSGVPSLWQTLVQYSTFIGLLAITLWISLRGEQAAAKWMFIAGIILGLAWYVPLLVAPAILVPVAGIGAIWLLAFFYLAAGGGIGTAIWLLHPNLRLNVLPRTNRPARPRPNTAA